LVARSRAAPGAGYFGEVPEGVWDVVESAWNQPFSLASNYAREHLLEVAFAASIGWISTLSPNGIGYSRLWHVTLEGLSALRNKNLM
jgi:hypothetical protein